MSEERRKILDMLSKGKITAEEAEKLLDAVESSERSPAVKSRTGELPEFLYVRVEPKNDAAAGDQVKITVPLSLITAGMNFVSLLPKDARKDVESAMEQSGVDFSLDKLSGMEAEALLAALKELVVDVETNDHIVKIYTS